MSGKYFRGALPREVDVWERHDLLDVERSLREVEAVTALIYDQTCAAEKRRRRKRGETPDPDVRAFINDRVCENCGDCSANPTAFRWFPWRPNSGASGRSTSPLQQGFFLRRRAFARASSRSRRRLHKARARTISTGSRRCPIPRPAPLDESLQHPHRWRRRHRRGDARRAASARRRRCENKYVTALDMAGLAQKGGPVTTHIRIAPARGGVARHAHRLRRGGGADRLRSRGVRFPRHHPQAAAGLFPRRDQQRFFHHQRIRADICGAGAHRRPRKLSRPGLSAAGDGKA